MWWEKNGIFERNMYFQSSFPDVYSVWTEITGLYKMLEDVRKYYGMIIEILRDFTEQLDWEQFSYVLKIPTIKTT